MQEPEFLDLTEGGRIAYHRTVARPERAEEPGIVFLGGLCSDMTGTKATFLEDRAVAAGRAYLRFDYTGHGRSSGSFAEGCVGDWYADARDAIRSLTQGPQILAGSSLGGWIALLLARDRSVPVAGVIGIAAAPDFTEDVLRDLTPHQRAELLSEGSTKVPSDYDEPYIFTARMIADGARMLLLEERLRLDVPLRLLHGTADVDVPVRTPLRLLDQLDCENARLLLVHGADHSFSGEAELAILQETLEELLTVTTAAAR